MEPLSNCSIGEKLESECHKDGKNRTSGFKELQHVSLEDQDVLKLRTNIKTLEGVPLRLLFLGQKSTNKSV